MSSGRDITAWMSTTCALRKIFAHGAVASFATLKVLLLGNGRAGKTQLRNRLCGRAFEERSELDPWRQDRVDQLRHAVRHEAQVRLHLWDFGGQDIYHGTHALFLRSPAINAAGLGQGHRERRRVRAWKACASATIACTTGSSCARRQGHRVKPGAGSADQVRSRRGRAHTLPIAAETIEALPYFASRCTTAPGTIAGGPRSTRRWARPSAGCAIRQRLGTPLIGAGRMRVQRRLEAMRDAGCRLCRPRSGSGAR